MAINIFESGSYVENATAVPVPFLAAQTGMVASGGPSSEFHKQTKFVIIQSDVACTIDIAESPDAGSTDFLIGAGETHYFQITKPGLSVDWAAA